MRIIAITALALLLGASKASAVGWKTQMNCASDYYAYCSQYQVGSQEVRQCMRRSGPKLSKACIEALIAEGEVSRAEVDRRSASGKSMRKTRMASKTGRGSCTSGPARPGAGLSSTCRSAAGMSGRGKVTRRQVALR